jgi:hypothetical protein
MNSPLAIVVDALGNPVLGADGHPKERRLAVDSAGALLTSGGGGGGGGASGSVTGAGTNGVLAQAIQGIENGVPVEISGYDPVYEKLVVGNARSKVRQGFDSVDWLSDFDVITTGAGDTFELDGNAAGATYLKIQKSPFNANTETYLLSKNSFKMPVRLAAAISLSQRLSGQEFYFEIVGVDAAGAILGDTVDAPISVSSITTATTTWTVNTTAPHNYVVGDPAQLFGFADTRFNLPLVANASVTGTASPTQFTVTGTNLSNASAGAGSVLRVRPSGSALEAAGYRWSGGTANNANPYTRSGSSSAFIGSEVAFGSSASTVPAGYAVANTYAHQASVSYEIIAQSESATWAAIAMDGVTPPTVSKRMQALPDIERDFKMAIRARNLPNLTVPVAEILTSTKSGTTTATHVTDVPHGLVTGDPVVIYGNRDQAATAFPNLTAATAVTVIDSTTFTVVQGTAGTATTTGGYVARVQGGNVAFGAIGGAVQSISRVNNQLLVIGSGNWTGLATGETAWLDGMDGAGAAFDGRYRVANVATTTLTLDAPGADFGSINCGGGVIKATDFRVHYSRALDYTRHLTEVVGGINRRDANNAVPVAIQPGSDPLAASQSGTWNIAAVTTAGTPPVPATPYFLNSAATTNGALIITGTSSLAAFHGTNTGAAAAFVKLYNKATAPVVGTDVPEMIIPIPAAVGGVPGVASPLSLGYIGLRFPLGLGIAITGGAADTDTTAVALGQVKIKLSRTV